MASSTPLQCRQRWLEVKVRQELGALALRATGDQLESLLLIPVGPRRLLKQAKQQDYDHNSFCLTLPSNYPTDRYAAQRKIVVQF